MALAIDSWRRRHAADIPRWLDVVGEFDALLALATFAAEHPAITFPELVDGHPQIAADGLAHPLLDASAVSNDIALGGAAPRLLVVSGSNMSGKSTLLRALGSTSCWPRPAHRCARPRLVLSPLAVGASIRVLDSLLDGKSRFYAEITRLKQVVDLVVAANGHVLFLLDEILSGTNSHDRRLGARGPAHGPRRRGARWAWSRRTISRSAKSPCGLGSLAANVHFEDRFEDGTMTFDYHLRPGVVRTSNAVELMRSVGVWRRLKRLVWTPYRFVTDRRDDAP